MIPRIENYSHSSVSGVHLYKPDGLLVLDVREIDLEKQISLVGMQHKVQ